MGKYAYVGCRTTRERNARGKGIKVYEILPSGEWKLIQLIENLVNPSYLCLDKKERDLYAVHGDQSEISSFFIDSNTGNLVYVNTVSTGGKNPVHLTVDKSNHWIFVANLETGTVAVISRDINGSLKDKIELYSIPGLEKDTISHPHQVAQDQTGNYLVVSCQGRARGFGQVIVFKIDHETGRLSQTCTVRSRKIAEPRHLVFHPNNRFCYGVNENDYSVTFYKFDEKMGLLSPVQILPTLPSTYTGEGWASGIDIGGSGEYIIVSNRKHDSITSFKIDSVTGMLTYMDCIKTEGKQPRFITIESGTNKILAANELSDTIHEFEWDISAGKLKSTGRTIATESPVCIVLRRD